MPTELQQDISKWKGPVSYNLNKSDVIYDNPQKTCSTDLKFFFVLILTFKLVFSDLYGYLVWGH